MHHEDFIAGLPKAELHLHIEGTLEPELMMALAERNDVRLPYDSVEAIRRAYDFSCLQDFLDLYYAGMSVLREKQDFFDLTRAYLERVHAQRVTHVEIFFDPQGHTERGVSFDTVLGGLVDALEYAERELELSARLIMCFLRHLSEEAAFETLSTARAAKSHIHAVGLDSSERGHPPSKFAQVFAAAREQGYLTVAHAGEEGPAEYVRQALDLLRVSRIDHGNRAIDEPALVARLAAEQVPLTLCPLSNLKLRVIEDMRQHPLKTLLDAGVRVTVNSDDPAYFGGYVNENYVAVGEALSLDRRELETIARNSYLGSFLGETEKLMALESLQRYCEGV